MLEQKLLFGLCHPLVDIQAKVNSEFLEKYGLERDNTILAEKRHMPIYEDVTNKFPVKYIPGGTTLNSIRVAQWMLGDAGRTFFSGSIGNDKFAKLLLQKVDEAGIDAIFYTTDEQPTGTCASLINNRGNRSLVTNLAAAKAFKKDHLEREDVWAMVKEASVFYFSGYFLTTTDGVETMATVAQHAMKSKQIFAFNLSATYICQCFEKELDGILPYCDFVFGNEDEAKSLAQKKKLTLSSPSNVEEIAVEIARLPKKNMKKKRIVIITQGCKPTIVADPDGNVSLFEVEKVDMLVDTNGAGDAFVGGFLAAKMQNKPTPECVYAGHWAASVIIQHEGCTFPKLCEYESSEDSS